MSAPVASAAAKVLEPGMRVIVCLLKRSSLF
jgi:hypothetical protein